MNSSTQMGTGTIWLWGTSLILQQVQLHSCLLIQSHLWGEYGTSLLHTQKEALKADYTTLEWLLRDSFLAMYLLFKRQDTHFGCRSWTDFVWLQSKWKKNKNFTKSATSFLLILMRLGRSHQIPRVLSRSLKTGEKCSNISINNSSFLLPELSKPPRHTHQHSCCKAAGLW